MCHNGGVKGKEIKMLSQIVVLSLVVSILCVACMRLSGMYDCKSWVGFGLFLWVSMIIVWVFVAMMACIF